MSNKRVSSKSKKGRSIKKIFLALGLVVLLVGVSIISWILYSTGVLTGTFNSKMYEDALFKNKVEQVVVDKVSITKSLLSGDEVQIKTDKGTFTYNPTRVNFITKPYTDSDSSIGVSVVSALGSSMFDMGYQKVDKKVKEKLGSVEAYTKDKGLNLGALYNIYSDNRLLLGIPTETDDISSDTVRNAFKFADLKYASSLKSGDTVTVQYYDRVFKGKSSKDIITLYKAPADKLLLAGDFQEVTFDDTVSSVTKAGNVFIFTLQSGEQFSLSSENISNPLGIPVESGVPVTVTKHITSNKTISGNSVDTISDIVSLVVNPRVQDTQNAENSAE